MDSFAAGVGARADTNQCFVFANWSDGASLPFASCLGITNIARFMLDHGLAVDFGMKRPDGGGTKFVVIGDVVSGQTISTWTGAYLTDTGVWTNNSDVHRKTDLSPIDSSKVLAQVVSLPITSWRYLNEDASKRHIGPMAQDFWRAFRLGDDE